MPIATEFTRKHAHERQSADLSGDRSAGERSRRGRRGARTPVRHARRWQRNEVRSLFDRRDRHAGRCQSRLRNTQVARVRTFTAGTAGHHLALSRTPLGPSGRGRFRILRDLRASARFFGRFLTFRTARRQLLIGGRLLRTATTATHAGPARLTTFTFGVFAGNFAARTVSRRHSHRSKHEGEQSHQHARTPTESCHDSASLARLAAR